jgi:hypothetical protein
MAEVNAQEPNPQATPESVAQPNAQYANAPLATANDAPTASVPSTAPANAPANVGQTPAPHARLAAMVQGLADGLSGLSAGMASKGRVSGAQVVQELQAGRQQMAQSKVAAAQAQKSAEIDNSLKTADTNQINVHTHMLVAQGPNELAKTHLEVTGAEQAQAITGADFAAQHGGSDPDEFKAKLKDQTPLNANGDAAGSFFMKGAQRELRGAQTAGIPDDNPAVQNMQKVLADPKATAGDVYSATQQLQLENASQGKAIDEQAKRQAAAETAPLGAKADEFNKMNEDRYQILHPGKPLPDEYKVNSGSTPKDLDRIHTTLKGAEDATGTKLQRDQGNQFRQQMLDLQKGVDIPGDNTKTGPEYLASLSKENPAMAANVRQIGEGRGAPPPAGARTPAALRLLGAVNLAYPEYDASRFPIYQKTRADFTSGGQVAKSLNGGHTVLQHLAALQQLNTDASRIPGTKAHQAFQNQLDTLAPELARFYGNETVEGIAGYKSTLGSILNRDVAIQQQAKSMREKFNGFQTQWESGSPPGAVSPVTIFGPKEQETYNKITGEGGGASSGKAVSLAEAMKLPVNAGKTEDQVRADITSHGHQVGQ